MEQIIGERENERVVRNRIAAAHQIAILHDEAARNTKFTVTGDADETASMLYLAPCSAAMRRTPPVPDRNRPLCMADIVRTDTNLIRMAFTREEDRNKGYMKRLMTGALEYQEQLNIPLCLVETDREEFFSRFGFHYIYDRPQYGLNTDVITEEMLERASGGDTIPLNPPDTVLKAADSDSLLTLAHFVNARLCRCYGLFFIRSAAYYEKFREELRGIGGNLFLIMENGELKGYFAYAKYGEGCIREAVFENQSDREQYLLETGDKKPAVMARAVNLPELLKHVSGNGKITVAVRLIDTILPRNDGTFLWYIDEKGSCMERVAQAQNSDGSDMRPEVTATIGAFTAFIFEYIALKHNAKFDNIYLAGPVKID